MMGFGQSMGMSGEASMGQGMGAMQEAVKDLVDSIDQLITFIGDIAKEMHVLFADSFGAFKDALLGMFTGESKPEDVMKALMEVLQNLMKAMIELAGISKLFDFLKQLSQLVTNPAFEIFASVFEGLARIFEAILKPLQPLFTLLGVVASILELSLAPIMQEIGQNIGPLVERMFDALKDIDMEFLLNAISNAMQGLGNTLVAIVPLLQWQMGEIGLVIIGFIARLPELILRIPDIMQSAIELIDLIVNTNFADIINSAVNLGKLIVLVWQQVGPIIIKFINLIYKIGQAAAAILNFFTFGWARGAGESAASDLTGIGMNTPMFQHGGKMPFEGLAYLHENERVLSAATTDTWETDMLFTMRRVERNTRPQRGVIAFD